MKRKKISIVFFSLLLLASCGKKTEQKSVEIPEYPVMSVKKQSETLQSVYPATIKGQEDIDIRPRIDGFIDAIYIDEGSVVKKGQSLFKINSPQSEQAVRTAEAAVTSAKASVETAELNVNRIRPLAEKGIVSTVQLQTYENAYQSAKASLAQAQATLTNARATLSWTNVTSPVNGVAGSIPYRIGSLVNKENSLTTIANTGNVFVYFSLNEKEMMDLLKDLPGNTQAEKIKNIPDVTLVLANGEVYDEKGKVSTIAGSVNISTGSANFRADFSNPQGLLRSGTSGKVMIPKVMEDIYVIPQKSTLHQQDKILTYKCVGDSAVQTLITVLPTFDGKSYVVTSGLNEGDIVIADGIATLKNGMKIKPKQ